MNIEIEENLPMENVFLGYCRKLTYPLILQNDMMGTAGIHIFISHSHFV